MTKASRLTLIAVGVAVLAAAGGGAGYYLWDRGMIPGNPRAPTAEAMWPAVQRTAGLMQRSGSIQCIGPDAGRVNPERSGIDGIASRDLPGQHAIAFLLQGAPHTQEARNAKIRQLHFFARLGFLVEEEVALDTESGTQPGRQYRLTWQGYANLHSGRGQGSPCFRIGSREVRGIRSMQKLPEQELGLELYDVEVETAAVDVPEWASSEEARGLFPKLEALLEPRTSQVRLLRGKSEWLGEFEAQVEVLRLKDRRQAEAYSRELARLREAEAPALDVPVETLVEQYYAEKDPNARATVACLPFRLRRGGDDPSLATARDGPYLIRYFDLPASARREYERNAMLTQLHMASALEAAGFARMRETGPGEVKGAKAARGVEFEIHDNLLSALGSVGSGCMPVGRYQVEPLAVHRSPGDTARLVARASLTQVPEWVAQISRHLPALRAAIEEGVPMEGTVAYMPDPARPLSAEAENKAWVLIDLRPSLPQIQVAAMPAALQAMLPETWAASRKPIKTPWANALPAVAPAPAASLPPVSLPRRAAPARPSVEPQRLQASAQPDPAPARQARSVLYPAGNLDVHAIGIYEGARPGAASRRQGEHPEGVVAVDVGVRGKATMLVLSSYEPIEWRVNVQAGARLEKVLAVGYYPQRVTITGASGVDVATRRRDVMVAAGIGDLGVPYKIEGNAAHDANEFVRALTGKSPATYQGQYRADRFAITDATPRFKVPGATAPSPTPVAAGAMRLNRGVWGGDPSSYRVSYAGSGAYTEAWAARGYSAGRVYFEGTMAVTQGVSSAPHANIGLAETRGDNGIEQSPDRLASAMRHGEQVLYKNGDVFGIAADLSAGLAYVHVNGTWITGAPGSPKGLTLRKGREYVAYFYATGGGGATSWEVNLGAAPFRYVAPQGYLPYDPAGSRK
jgi:hypothetical protein